MSEWHHRDGSKTRYLHTSGYRVFVGKPTGVFRGAVEIIECRKLGNWGWMDAGRFGYVHESQLLLAGFRVQRLEGDV